MIRALTYLAAVALLAAVWWGGYSMGRSAEQRALAAHIEALENRLAAISAANRAAAAELEKKRAEQAALALEVEDEARQDPDAVRRVPGPDSLRRLERRWGAPN